MSAVYIQASTERSTVHRRRNFNMWIVHRCSVFNEVRFWNLTFELKFLDVFTGREDPIELDIWPVLFYCLFVFLSRFKSFVGVMRGLFLVMCSITVRTT
jgi:hypothetical protein